MRPGAAIDLANAGRGATDLVHVGRLGRPTWSMQPGAAIDLVNLGRGGDRLGYVIIIMGGIYSE